MIRYLEMVRLSPFFIFIAAGLLACHTPGELVNRNYAPCYRPDQQAASPPDFAFHQLDDSTVRVHVRINTHNLLFSRQDDGSFSAGCGVHIRIMRSYETPALMDSCTFMHTMGMDQRDRYSDFSFTMGVHADGELLALIRLTDINRGDFEERYFRFRMGGIDERNSFLVISSSGAPRYCDWLTTTDTFRIINRLESLQEVMVRYYDREFPLASPPFGIDNRVPFDYKPDSVFKMRIGAMYDMVFSKTGFYHISTDTLSRNGLTLFCFEEGYPKVVSTYQMLEPVRFLTVRSEFTAMKESSSLRKSMDDFWLARCDGSKDKSKMLIQKYYQRVQWANRLFSSFTEGWRTDRGMLYIVMGAPNAVFRSSNIETWVYGTVNSPTSLNFMFVKVDNPFTDNDYSLNRSPVYENAWYRAVDSWRQGRAYNTID